MCEVRVRCSGCERRCEMDVRFLSENGEPTVLGAGCFKGQVKALGEAKRLIGERQSATPDDNE